VIVEKSKRLRNAQEQIEILQQQINPHELAQKAPQGQNIQNLHQEVILPIEGSHIVRSLQCFIFF